MVTHGAADLRIANHPALFTDGYCRRCMAPIGSRTDEPLRVSYATGRHWRFHAGMAAIPSSTLPHPVHGPKISVYSGVAVEWLTALAPGVLAFRPVNVIGQHVHSLFELVSSSRHRSFARLVDDRLDDAPSYRDGHCPVCDRQPEPYYTGPKSLPERLAAIGTDETLYLTNYFLRTSDVADPDIPFWTAGYWDRASLGMVWATAKWKAHVRAKQPTSGMNPTRVGLVDDSLAAPA